jgi:hypothetical protein
MKRSRKKRKRKLRRKRVKEARQMDTRMEVSGASQVAETHTK